MATLVRWEPLREIAALQNEMSRFLNGLHETNGHGRPNAGWLPATDVWETEKDVVYAFDLPGVPENKISVEIDEGALTVSAERERDEEVEQGDFARLERRFGTFSRTLGLPQGAKDTDVKATVEHGVLYVHVAKPEQPKPRKVQVTVSERSGSEHDTIEASPRSH